MSSVSDFDALHAGSWRPLLLQTFAVCGDLGAAREALDHAYVDAWHHWGRAVRQGPEAYVREHAFHRALWRGRARAFHRPARVSKPQRVTLQTLQELSVPQRKAVVLGALTDLSLDQIAQQVAETPARTETLLAGGLETARTTLNLPDHLVVQRIRELDAPVRAAAQPVAADLRRRGVRRRRGWLAATSAAAVALTVGAGTLVQAAPLTDDDEPAAPRGPAVTASMLLGASGLRPVGAGARWQTRETGDNTKGSGINSFCQQSRFADSSGLRTLVRTFRHAGEPRRTAAQTLELSRTESRARAAYRTAVGWYAGCTQARVQLLTSYEVTGLADQATILKFRATGDELRSYAVGLARTGDITTWTAVETRGAKNPETDRLLRTLTRSVRKVCDSRAAGSCGLLPTVTENAPPPSGEQEGMLAVADLPPAGTIDRPWVGTRASTASVNPSATTCDRADFLAAGARPTLSRTFLIPGADTPPRFGLSETYGRFGSVAAAKAFLSQARTRMDGCEDKDPGATVRNRQEQLKGTKGSVWVMWRLTSEVSDKQSVTYWMGITRVGSDVAQVAFVPGDSESDVSAEAFRDLVVRARDRLFELPAPRPTAAPSASPSPSSDARSTS